MESRGWWNPNGKSEEWVAREGRDNQSLESSIGFNTAWEAEKGERVWPVEAKLEDHEWQEEFNSNQRQRETLEKLAVMVDYVTKAHWKNNSRFGY